MGDIIQRFRVRTAERGVSLSLRILFDTGSPVTLITISEARRLGSMMKLPHPSSFGGLGNGRFAATHLIELKIHFMNLWCPHVAYVVPDAVLDESYEILAGHDLMQRYDIQALPRRREVRLDRGALRMGLRVR